MMSCFLQPAPTGHDDVGLGERHLAGRCGFCFDNTRATGKVRLDCDNFRRAAAGFFGRKRVRTRRGYGRIRDHVDCRKRLSRIHGAACTQFPIGPLQAIDVGCHAGVQTRGQARSDITSIGAAAEEDDGRGGVLDGLGECAGVRLGRIRIESGLAGGKDLLRAELPCLRRG
jgi:hypothetical protein